jgi:hypothetical protein
VKDIFSQFIDFITGGFFNVLGAVVRLPFSKKKYGQLLEEPTSNYLGMVVMTIILLGLYLSIQYRTST